MAGWEGGCIAAYDDIGTEGGLGDEVNCTLSSVKVGENHVVLGYGIERPMY